MTKKKIGFTLIEILIAITVFCLLAIFSYLFIPKYLVKAKDAVRKSDIKLISTTIEEYFQDTGCYPKSLPLCDEPIANGDLILFSSLPCDPKTKNSYVYVTDGKNCPSWYQIYGILEYTPDPIIDRVGCRNGCGPQCQFNYGATSTNQKLNPFCEGEAIPAPSPAATNAPSPIPATEVLQYVCAPGKSCEVFANPEISGCPNIYPNDPTCGQTGSESTCSEKLFTCKDSKGKTN